MADEREGSPDSDGRNERKAPLEDLSRAVDERRAQRRNGSRRSADAGVDTTVDADADIDALFEQVDVDSVDREQLWTELGDVGDDEVDDSHENGEETVETADAVETADPHEHIVSKRDYCQQCPHFSAPPDATCRNEGTDIVEVVSFDEFRVRHCPVVEERFEAE